MANCKFCGSTYGVNDEGKDTVLLPTLLWMLAFGRRAWTRSKYCCVGHYERHTEKDWATERMIGIKRMPLRFIKIFGVFIIIGIYGQIKSCMNPKINETNQNKIESTIDSSKTDTLNQTTNKPKKKKKITENSQKSENIEKAGIHNDTNNGNSEDIPKE